MESQMTKQVQCFYCNRCFPPGAMISGELIRPRVADLISRESQAQEHGKA